ncbi:MAG: PIN/TRAM domain-containing protein [Coriobacteriia bacterium]
MRLTRFVAFVAGAMGGFAVSQVIDWTDEEVGLGLSGSFVIIIFVILGASIGYLFGGIVGREITRLYEQLDERLRNVALSDLTLGSAGMLVGLVASWLAANPLRLIRPSWLSIASIMLLTAFVTYACIRIALLRREEFSRLFLGSRWAQEGAPAPLHILDTSAIIDGRFVSLAKVGGLPGRLVVPNFVLSELQTLADSSDDLKRARGRRGLDLLETLKRDRLGVDMMAAEYPHIHDVDSKLLQLAQDTEATLVTVDYNLTKVARVKGVSVLNINELANALRPNIVTGQRLAVSLVREGKEPGQGVAYLEDGTMVVVEKASDLVGEDVEIEVTSVFQAAAGRMIFARLARQA